MQVRAGCSDHRPLSPELRTAAQGCITACGAQSSRKAVRLWLSQSALLGGAIMSKHVCCVQIRKIKLHYSDPPDLSAGWLYRAETSCPQLAATLRLLQQAPLQVRCLTACASLLHVPAAPARHV